MIFLVISIVTKSISICIVAWFDVLWAKKKHLITLFQNMFYAVSLLVEEECQKSCIFGEKVVCRIHLLSSIWFLKLRAWRGKNENSFLSQICFNTPQNVIYGSKLSRIGRHHVKSQFLKLHPFCSQFYILANN